MRLIFVTDTLGSGGAERVVSILANYFSNRYQTEIICLRKIEVFYKVSPDVNLLFADDYAKGWLGKLIWMRKYVTNEDVILPFMVKVYSLVLLALIGRDVSIIASERNDPRKTEQPWKLFRPFLLRKVRYFIVQTKQIKDYFPKSIRKKTIIVLNPVDDNNCHQGDWDGSSKVILAVGRTDPQKNYPMMIRAFSKIHASYPEFKLVIWGSKDIAADGPLRLLADDLNCSSSISINGRSNAMAEIYGKSYMFVMTSNYEGLSNALIEALCSGLPVVSTRVSGAVDVVRNNENGVLVDIGDEEGFYLAMKHVIDDRHFAERIACNAKKSRKLFLKERICNQWDNLIKEVII